MSNKNKMETAIKERKDIVRSQTSDKVNAKIDEALANNVRYYASQGRNAMRERIRELDEEWDIERTLELNAALVALTGVILAATVNKKWLILPALVTTFLSQHAIQGWCPPLPLFRSLGVRTQKEIEAERNELIKHLNTNHREIL